MEQFYRGGKRVTLAAKDLNTDPSDKKDAPSVRDIDPSVRQSNASDPEYSVWVEASAGTGKTKVLTDRILRLLLPDKKGVPGTKPHRILALTFTKAAATEMITRISEKLSDWSVMEERNLKASLESLLGFAVDNAALQTARSLFAEVIETPGGLKIMTIHAFCQSVLARFPLEANISPSYSVIEDSEVNKLLKKARERVFSQAEQDPICFLAQNLECIAREQNDKQFTDLVSQMNAERRQLKAVLHPFSSQEELYNALAKLHILNPDDTEQSILESFCEEAPEDAIKIISSALSQSTKTDQKNAFIIEKWLNSSTEERTQDFSTYQNAYSTQKNTARKIGKAIKNYDDIYRVHEQERNRIQDAEKVLRSIKTVRMTCALLSVGYAILEAYDEEKIKHAQLDYNDLIEKTLALLEEDSQRSWVMFKLDGGLDHILIDEAQDTNPEQWQIIERLCGEFFSGEGVRPDIERTLFVVGDKKQSIYSFQRAAPQEFENMLTFFAKKAKNCKKNWREEDLNISFRSTKSVLQAVDSVFSMSPLSIGLEQDNHERDNTKHIPFRKGEEGIVEIWPLFEDSEKEESKAWDPPIQISEHQSAQTKLCEHIASQIETWIANKEFLPSKNRVIEPQDILILLRSRSSLMEQLVKSLKIKNLPVSGVDRMVLKDQLCIQDLVAAAEFGLFPRDDLTLACLLKSPLINFSEESLFKIARHRAGSLWNALQQSPYQEISRYCQYILKQARALSPSEFFSALLQSPCPGDAISGRRALEKRLGHESLDPIEEFVTSVLRYEESTIPSLQDFVRIHKTQASEIKREQEETGHAIRIMTVHGAKGLQAPIVIMPDTTRPVSLQQGKTGYRLLWPNVTKLELPLWAPKQESESELYKQSLSYYKDAQEQEYNRLLYVAMTRAEDRLYVTGTKKKNMSLNSWYFQIENGIQTLSDHTNRDGVIQLYNPSIKNIDDKKGRSEHISRSKPLLRDLPPAELPHWATQEHKEKNLAPAIAVTKTAKTKESSQEALRGTAIHTLLQHLPSLPANMRKDKALAFLEKNMKGTERGVQILMAEEAINIIENPIFSEVFGPNALAEVPIVGIIKGKAINGQIDRLCVKEDEILVLDYKTHRTIPDSEEGIPASIIQQLQSYKELLQPIYPKHAIRCAILWTYGPVLMPLEKI